MLYLFLTLVEHQTSARYIQVDVNNFINIFQNQPVFEWASRLEKYMVHVMMPTHSWKRYTAMMERKNSNMWLIWGAWLLLSTLLHPCQDPIGSKGAHMSTSMSHTKIKNHFTLRILFCPAGPYCPFNLTCLLYVILNRVLSV